MKLTFTVRGQEIRRTDTNRLASDSRLYISGKVSFDAEWSDITSRYLTFELEDTSVVHAYLDGNGEFLESLGVSLCAGLWLVSAHGSNFEGKRIDTIPIDLYIAKAGGSCEGNEPYVPPDAAGQIAAIAAEANKKANEALQKAGEAGKYVDEIKSIHDEIEETISNIDLSGKRFEDMDKAEEYAKENGIVGAIMSVYSPDIGWRAYVVQDDYTLEAICGCDMAIDFDVLEGGYAGSDTSDSVAAIDGGEADDKLKDIALDGGNVYDIQ